MKGIVLFPTIDQAFGFLGLPRLLIILYITSIKNIIPSNTVHIEIGRVHQDLNFGFDFILNCEYDIHKLLNCNEATYLLQL